MNKKIKFLSTALLIAVTALSVSLFGCNPKADDDGKGDNNPAITTAKVAAPDGAPSLALGQLIAGGAAIENANISYDVVMSDATTEAATIVGAKLVSGDYDMAILPTNLAATLYNKGAKIKLVSVNTWGNLFIVSKQAVITDLKALKGEVVYVVSQSGPPMAVLKYLLKQANIQIATDDEVTESSVNGVYNGVSGKVAIKYMPATSMIPNLKQGKIKYGLLGEPAVTNAIKAINGQEGTDGKVVLDLQAAWNTATGSGSYPQASLVVRDDFLTSNKAFVDSFVASLTLINDWVKREGNFDKVKTAIIGKAESTSLANMTVATFDRCGVSCKTAADSKAAIKAYLAAFSLTVTNDFYYAG